MPYYLSTRRRRRRHRPPLLPLPPPQLEWLGGRRLALVALISLKKCKIVLELGGTSAVLEVLRVVSLGKVATDGTPTQAGATKKQSAPSRRRLWCLSHPELLRCAINALLNLSIEASNQVWLAQHALPHLLELVCEPQMQSRPHEWTMLARLLENLSSNNDNRSRLYPAELVLRTMQHQHMAGPEMDINMDKDMGSAAAVEAPQPTALPTNAGPDPLASVASILGALETSAAEAVTGEPLEPEKVEAVKVNLAQNYLVATLLYP